MRLFRRHSRRPSKLAERRRKTRYVRTGLGAMVVVALLSLSSYLAHRPELQIRTIVVSGNQVLTDEQVAAVVQEELSGSYFFLFPRSNVLLAPREKVVAAVLGAFERVEAVSVSTPDLHSLSLEVVEEDPHSLWCPELDPVAASAQCYFLNENGLIFAEAPDFTGNVFFIFRGDVDASDPIGRVYLSERDEFQRVNVFLEALRGLGLQPVMLRVLDNDDSEVTMEDGSRIIFGRAQNYSELVVNLKSVLSLDNFTRDDADLDYIDLRFGNKVYYRYR